MKIKLRGENSQLIRKLRETGPINVCAFVCIIIKKKQEPRTTETTTTKKKKKTQRRDGNDKKICYFHR